MLKQRRIIVKMCCWFFFVLRHSDGKRCGIKMFSIEIFSETNSLVSSCLPGIPSVFLWVLAPFWINNISRSEPNENLRLTFLFCSKFLLNVWLLGKIILCCMIWNFILCGLTKSLVFKKLNVKHFIYFDI